MFYFASFFFTLHSFLIDSDDPFVSFIPSPTGEETQIVLPNPLRVTDDTIPKPTNNNNNGFTYTPYTAVEVPTQTPDKTSPTQTKEPPFYPETQIPQNYPKLPPNTSRGYTVNDREQV
jgi:hypothetical protein